MESEEDIYQFISNLDEESYFELVDSLGENFEQIDEISQKTLASYYSKAIGDRHSKDLAQDSAKRRGDEESAKKLGDKVYNRSVGLEKAKRKFFAKEETEKTEDIDLEESEILDEMKQGQSYSQKQIEQKIKSGDWEAVTDIKPGKHVELRHHTGKRVQVHVKEEVEQIEELSKDTLKSYIKKAATGSKGAEHLGRSYERSQQSGDSESSKKIQKKLDNREKGIGKAVDRLTKEEVEQSLEESTISKYSDFLSRTK